MEPNNISQEEFEQIEAYINGELEGEKLNLFQQRLNNEDGFKAKVEDIKTLLSGIETQALKEKLNEFHKEVASSKVVGTPKKIRSFNWKPLAIAATLIIALGCFWVFGDNSNERLYSKYYKPDPGLPTTMSGTDNYEFYEAMVDYKQGNYKKAISKWKALQKAKPNNDTLNYFLGSAQMANKNEPKAISYLEKVSTYQNSVFINDAYYYLGLAYLKTGNIVKAKSSLKKSNLKNSKDLLSKISD